MRVTKKAINAALAKAAETHSQLKDVEIEWGNGYFYFCGGDASGWYQTGVYGTFTLGEMTVQEWVNTAIELSKEREI